jgi:hypothetical protein
MSKIGKLYCLEYTEIPKVLSTPLIPRFNGTVDLCHLLKGITCNSVVKGDKAFKVIVFPLLKLCFSSDRGHAGCLVTRKKCDR